MRKKTPRRKTFTRSKDYCKETGAQRLSSLRQKRGNNKEYHSTAILSQRDGRMHAEIRRRKNNRPSCFISRAEKQTQRRNGRMPAEIRRRKNNPPSCFISRAEKQTQRRNGRTPAEIRRRKNNRPSCFISRAEKQTQRRNGRMPAEIRRRKNNRPSCFISRAEKQTQRRNGRTPSPPSAACPRDLRGEHLFAAAAATGAIH